MALIGDDLLAWLVALLADAGRKRLTAFMSGNDQERALREATAAAILNTAAELCPDSSDSAEQLALVIDRAFGQATKLATPMRSATLLQALQDAIAVKLSLVAEAELTGAGEWSADLPELRVSALAERLSGNLLREIVVRGVRGGPLHPLATQLNFDQMRLQGEDLRGDVQRLADEVRRALNAPPPAQIQPATHTLPADVASFIGRQAELELLVGALPAGDRCGGIVRIDAIDGMPGVGKTAFAVHAAHMLAHQYPDGQIFVPLHGHTPGREPAEPADALVSLLLADGVAPQQIPGGVDGRAALWRDRMTGREAILLLDDVTGSEQIRPLIPGSAGILVLITSRHRLTDWPDALRISLDILKPDEGARLFVELVGRGGLNPHDAEIADVVRLCGYLPLAISLVAGQMKHHDTWTVEYVAAELQSVSGRLGRMAANNASVAAAFDLSYRHLRPDQQEFFSRLGLHPGSSVDAYAAAALNDSDMSLARKNLDELFEYHMIEEPALGRYRFHDLIGQYARSLAAEQGGAANSPATIRLLDYYLYTTRVANRFVARRTSAGVPDVIQRAPASVPDLSSRAAAVSWLAAEQQNLADAVKFAAANGLPGYALALPGAMHGFLRSQGQWDDALRLHALALAAAISSADALAEAAVLVDLGDMQYVTDDYAAAAANLSRARSLYKGINDLGEANALTEQAFVEGLTGDFPAAADSLNRALELYTQAADLHGLATVFSRLGAVQTQQGDYQDAAASLARAMQLYSDVGDGPGRAAALNRLGVVQALTGKLLPAVVSQNTAAELNHELGDRLGEANARTDLSMAQRAVGKNTAADESISSAIELYRDLGDQMGEAYALIELGALQNAMGTYDQAQENLVKAAEMCHERGDEIGEATAINNLGTVQHSTGNSLAAAASHAQSLSVYRGHEIPLGEAEALRNLGVVYTAIGDFSAASQYLTDAHNLYAQLSQRAGQADTLNSLGELSLATGDHNRAHYEAAIAIASEIGARPEEARALEGIGQCDIRDGRSQDGSALLQQAQDIYHEMGSPKAQRLAEALDELHRPQ
jgi:tetratricopeptide (TPR) repeat protein